MDKRLILEDSPRPVPPGTSAETPLVTVAWRALRAEHQRRAEQSRQAAEERDGLLRALAAVAAVAHRLRHATPEQLPAALARLQEALAQAGIVLVAPEGEPFQGELTELLENVAQRPQPGLTGPRVAEVLAPAVLYRGGVLRMGKAVIAVPATGE
jgi:predicted amidohydrolase YtcJ